MSRPVSTTLLALCLLLSVLSSPALARLIIGITPTALPGAADPALLKILEDDLTVRFGETVRIRSFDNETTQLDWLIRFRELDAAMISRNLLQTLPAGTLILLSDRAATVVVTHPGTAAPRQEALRRVFSELFADDPGRQMLRRLDGTAKVPAAPERAAPSVTAARPPEPVKSAEPAPTGAKPGTPLPTPPASGLKPAAPLPATAEPHTSTPPPSRQVVTPSAAAPPATPAPVVTPKTSISPSALPVSPAPVADERNPKRTRLLLAAAALLAVGIGVKSVLLLRYRSAQRKEQIAPPDPPAAGEFALVTASSTAEQAPSLPVSEELSPGLTEPSAAETGTSEPPVAIEESTPKKRIPARRKAPVRTAGDNFPAADAALVVEQGRLGKIKVPALLKSCADLPQPVLLRVRSGDSETCIHFAGGQICHAWSRNWRIDQGSLQWSKLATLMVRDGVLFEAQRDQVLELIERRPELRFAEAMQQLGMFDLDALRQILTRQAKTVVFALILFSSGEYRIETDDGSIPAEESVALQVEPLIREASHHQAEWTAIRKVLPSLTTLLDFAPEGREKLEQVRLSVHQELLLSQVDGQTPLSTLCSDSTMMDYEACRFLYLMVKAGVLKAVPAT